MKKIRIGIICPSEIAFRRFMPALSKNIDFEYVGVAYPSLEEWNGASESNIETEKEKAMKFQASYGGNIYNSYESIIKDVSIDAIYLPLPPALHFYWAKLALLNNKHVFLEKPSTTNLKDTSELIEIAKEKELALHENYMFQYHNQIEAIKNLITSNCIGQVRLITANFGFPKRASNDFRYNKNLGGGALLDCGGYPIRLVSLLMEGEVTLDAAKLLSDDNDVDIYGSLQLSTTNQVSHISFGMDNAYKCEVEIWGSIGTIKTDRAFTAPDGFDVEIQVNRADGLEVIKIPGDDAFYKSIDIFKNCVFYDKIRKEEYNELLKQISLIDAVRNKHK